MCGITGILHFDTSRPADETRVRIMTSTLIHRGPDGEGYFIHNNVGLGHRRLSIIDLNTGDQPMFNDDKTIALIFNGEIYNYLELRDELKKSGVRFFTESDTEVIIRAYEKWGTECQNKLNGMWAFALWDEKKKHLFISRDRLGEKPLYYAFFDNTFIFGSEIKSILAYGMPVSPDLELTGMFLCLGYIPAPYSYYKGISKLRQGHYLLIDEGVVSENKYWDIPAVNEGSLLTGKKMVYETFESLLRDAVKIRMRSDVPYGAFLSGGLDSSSVVAVMSEISSTPVQTFTIGSSDRVFDERRLARDVALKFKTNHSEYVVEPDNFYESLQKILHHYDEPFGDSSAIPTGYVSKIASGNVKMVLTGDGGDEVLSGYNSNQAEKYTDRYRNLFTLARMILSPVVRPASFVVQGQSRYLLNRIGRVLSYASNPFNNRLLIKSSWFHPEYVERLTAGLGKQMKLADFINDFYAKYQAKHSFYKLMLFQFKVLLPDDFLVKVDRMSMAYSLETRIPFLDHRLVEFMINVHMNVKMEGLERKSVLRNTVGKKLPASILKGSKKGFSIPMREWFKERTFDGALKSLYEDDFGLDKNIIKKVVHSNKAGKEDLGNFIWMLFVLKNWLGKNGGKA